MLVQETPQADYLVMRISRPGPDAICEFGPRHLVNLIVAASWKIYCRRHSCDILQPPFQSIFTADGEGQPDPADANLDRSTVVRRLKTNTLARWWTLLCHSGDFRTDTNSYALLRQDECLSCCIRTAAALDKKVVYIIS